MASVEPIKLISVKKQLVNRDENNLNMSVIINNLKKIKGGETDERHRRAQSTMVTGERLHTQRMSSMSTQESLREPY